MKRKLISLALVGASLITLSACGNSSSSSSDGGNSGGGSGDAPTTIKIMFHVDASSVEGKAYKKRIDAFKREYADEGLKVSASYIARTSGASAYETDLTNKQNEGTLPDIITFDAPNCASYANSRLLYDITDLLDDEIKNDFISISTYNDRVYGLPIQESSAGFYYNKNLFKQAGIDVSGVTATNPWTFDDFKSACSKLKAINVTPVDMRLDATKDETATYMLYPFIYAAGGEFISEDGFTSEGYLDSAKTVEGFEYIKSLVTSGYTSYAIGATDFFDGKVGMYLSSGWTIPDLDNKYPTTFPNRDSWGLLPYPKGVKAASATGSWCFGVTNNKTTNKENVMKLLEYLTSPESSKVITDATGMIPARKSVETNYAPNSPEDVLYTQLKTSGIARPATVGYPKFSTCFNQIISEIKEKDVQEVCSAKAKSLQTELDRLNR